jgi:DNA-binding NarL/FixJ family response regulator
MTSSTSSSSERRTVLLVENDPVLRRAIRLFLDLAGFEVMESDGVEEARYLVANSARLDAIVAELDGPGAPVEDLTRAVRRLHPRAVTVVCTTRTSAARRAALRDAGVDAFVSKIDLTTQLLPELNERLGR